MSRYRLTEAERDARRKAHRAELDALHARRPLFRRTLDRVFPPAARAALRAILGRAWKFTLGRFLFAKLHLDPDAAHAEAAALSLVRAHTAVPVPRVLGVLPWFGDHYVLMTRVRRAIPLPAAWPALAPAARARVLSQVRTCVAQLRAIRRPPTRKDKRDTGTALICSANGGPLHDARLPARHRGPFASERAFNAVLRAFEPLSLLPAHVRASHARAHAIVFTHGDVVPRNVLVDADGRGDVRALVDWDAAGWLPDHWEFRKARWTADVDGAADADEWAAAVAEPAELEADADDYLARRFWAPS